MIAENSIIAGVSAKREPTRLASVRRALFTEEAHRKSVSEAIKKHGYSSVMIIATSDAMAEKIALMLEISPISKYIRIEDIASPDEIELARHMRIDEGQHVIPVPTFRIKKYFSGYFLHPFRLLQKNLDENGKYNDDKSIVRPTFSYMGQYTISDNVLLNMAIHEAMQADYVERVVRINSRTSPHGIHIDMTITLTYGCNICEACKNVQSRVGEKLQEYTSINVRRVNILVKNLKR